ncbi:MAG: formate/nitrite transporter family protein [Armatimonadetes bacterium]|nr:formate/nitrite transporter family protein [Armatimonadota bacterium]
MSYVKPETVVEAMIQAGENKAKLPTRDLLVRGFLSGALLGFATTLAFTASGQTGVKLFGALVFPVGFVMIVLLGLELVTGNFALLPLPVLERRAGLRQLFTNWSWVFLGNLLGSLFYAYLFCMTIAPDSPIAKAITEAATVKTQGYAAMGARGWEVAVVKAILCNWMVTMGVVMALTSATTGGKILAMWLPILTFFAQGFEHSVVNMFVIPSGMLLGAEISFSEWWWWNQIPVTFGNLLGGAIFTGLALYYTHSKKEKAPVEASLNVPVYAEPEIVGR